MAVESKLSPKAAAKAFVDACDRYGFSWEVRGAGVVSISKSITVGSNAEFCDAESEASTILYDICPLRGGSVWGTDGGSIGGAVALQSGRFCLKKSGTGKRFLAELAKLR